MTTWATLTDEYPADVVTALRAVWADDAEGASRWMHQWCDPLRGRPAELVRDEAGARRVVGLLREGAPG